MKSAGWDLTRNWSLMEVLGGGQKFPDKKYDPCRDGIV